MARREYRYLVLDCETATLPFANEIAENDPERKKKIAIARPLIYDIGWTITNRKGEILGKKQFLIAETFFCSCRVQYCILCRKASYLSADA